MKTVITVIVCIVWSSIIGYCVGYRTEWNDAMKAVTLMLEENGIVDKGTWERMPK
jgi:hypothetical protein